MTCFSSLARLAVLAAVLGWAVLPGAALAADKNAEKAARRLQLQMQNLQQQVQEAQAAKARAEADKAALDQRVNEQTQQVVRLQGPLRKTRDALKAAEAARAALAATVASLEAKLAEQTRNAEAAQAAAAQRHDEQQALLQRQRDEQAAQVAECTAKNERLIRLSAELLDQYRNKGVLDALKQRDVVLGLGDVEVFNLVQNYRDKADAERFTPARNPSDPAK